MPGPKSEFFRYSIDRELGLARLMRKSAEASTSSINHAAHSVCLQLFICTLCSIWAARLLSRSVRPACASTATSRHI
jgi:hypothetical protein